MLKVLIANYYHAWDGQGSGERIETHTSRASNLEKVQDSCSMDPLPTSESAPNPQNWAMTCAKYICGAVALLLHSSVVMTGYITLSQKVVGRHYQSILNDEWRVVWWRWSLGWKLRLVMVLGHVFTLPKTRSTSVCWRWYASRSIWPKCTWGTVNSVW